MVMNSKSILGNPLREKIERDTADYLARGGKIQKIPFGVGSGNLPKFGSPVKGKPNAKQRRGLAKVMGWEVLMTRDAKAGAK